MNEVETVQKKIDLFKGLLKICYRKRIAESLLTALLKHEKKLEQLIEIKNSKLAYFMRQKNWEMVVEMRRVDEFGGHEILRELVSFPVDAEGTYYERGIQWTSKNGIVIENIHEFASYKIMIERDMF
jgi:hypothetical protein